MSPFRRWLVKWSRTVHLYATLLALVAILFFTATGFMLNHEDWFGTSDPRMVTVEGTVPTALLKEPDKLVIVELLRKDFRAVGAMSSFETEEDQLRVVFKRPGTEVSATIKRDTGETETTIMTRGLAGLMLDLHRGKSTGTPWSLLIDLTCVALAAIAATGIVLWWTLKGRGHYGILVILAGLALSAIAYWYGVP
ncbi:MAG: PepSY-associated TM helix domain-containing protein [Gemmataceae bacterium]